MQTAQEQTQQMQLRKVIEKNRDFDALQKQLQQVHAQLAPMLITQEQAQQKHSREVLEKNNDIDAVQKQLKQAHTRIMHARPYAYIHI